MLVDQLVERMPRENQLSQQALQNIHLFDQLEPKEVMTDIGTIAITIFGGGCWRQRRLPSDRGLRIGQVEGKIAFDLSNRLAAIVSRLHCRCR
jgi:hypothetical protein